MRRLNGVARTATVVSILVLSVGACGGAAPSGAPGANPSVPAAGSAPAPAPDGVTLIDIAATEDPVAAAAREHELDQEIREDAGMVALLSARGADGEAVFAALDGIEAGFAQVVLRDAATAVDTGAFPEGAGTDPLDGRLASLGEGPTLVQTAPGAIDISLFAETGFTTSALMSMFSWLVERAGETGAGLLSRSEPYAQTADGLRQEVDLTTTMRMSTGGGKVSAEITLTATDRIFKASDDSFVALYTSTSTGQFEVAACPDTTGLAKGEYSFQTKHELNDVSASVSARSGGGRSVEAPFALVNGPDARLQRIEATLDLRADANGPGSASGPGPTSPFDWAASQVLQIVMPASGAIASGSGQGATVTGTGGERAGGAMFLSSAMAQLFIGQVAKEAEQFWRLGKCFEVKTNKESRKVERNEQFDVEVSSIIQKFDRSEVDEPVVVTFTGKERIEPTTGTRLDMPAKVTFTAGGEPRDKGTLKFEQTSIRGIAKKTLDFEVQPEDLWIQITGRLDLPGANLRLSTSEYKLEKTDQGFQQVVTGDVTGTVEALGCSESVSRETALRVLAVVDEADRDLVRLFVSPTTFELDDEQEITCNGVTTRVFVPVIDFELPFLGTDGSVTVRMDEPTTFRYQGVEVTVTLRRDETET